MRYVYSPSFYFYSCQNETGKKRACSPVPILVSPRAACLKIFQSRPPLRVLLGESPTTTFPGGTVVKIIPSRDLGSSPDLNDPLEEEMATLLSVMLLKNPMDTRARWAIFHGVTK